MTTIRLLELVPGAQQATGHTVIIDVLRAFSVACYAFAGGASRVFPVGSIADAWALKERLPDALLVGERGGIKLPGFDFGNSPTEIVSAEIHGKAIIHTTSQGTQGIVNAAQSQRLFTGSFVNADAMVRLLTAENSAEVSLVAMGSNGKSAIEDVTCAHYIRDRLQGATPDFADMRQRILSSHRAVAFLDESRPDFPATDLDYCLQVGRFDFVLEAISAEVDGMAVHELRRIDVA